jgi:hypothetical protein
MPERATGCRVVGDQIAEVSVRVTKDMRLAVVGSPGYFKSALNENPTDRSF